MTEKKYAFVTLDPRNIPAAQEANEKIFSNGTLIYGVEVTVPVLARLCAINIDPQHIGNDASQAAIEVAMTARFPQDRITFVTVRADVDSVGAMAVFMIRHENMGALKLKPVLDRIKQVVIADSFAHGGWPGPKPLPTRENPWPKESTSADSTRSLAAIAAAVMDFKVPLETRVATMENWLLTGEEPAQYRAQIEKERQDLITALETGQIKYETPLDGRIAVVESTHRAATSVGYCLAPVVIALNPAFRFAGGEPHRKFTISAFEPKFADIKGALAELAELEPGWGGSPTIGGSPQGVSSKLTTEQVVSIAEKHLRAEPGDRPCNCGAAKVMEPHEHTQWCG